MRLTQNETTTLLYSLCLALLSYLLQNCTTEQTHLLCTVHTPSTQRSARRAHCESANALAIFSRVANRITAHFYYISIGCVAFACGCRFRTNCELDATEPGRLFSACMQFYILDIVRLTGLSHTHTHSHCDDDVNYVALISHTPTYGTHK